MRLSRPTLGPAACCTMVLNPWGRAVVYLHDRTAKKEKLELCLLEHVRGSPPMLSQVYSCPRRGTTNTEVEVILCRDPLLAHYRTLLFPTTSIKTSWYCVKCNCSNARKLVRVHRVVEVR